MTFTSVNFDHNLLVAPSFLPDIHIYQKWRMNENLYKKINVGLIQEEYLLATLFNFDLDKNFN